MKAGNATLLLYLRCQCLQFPCSLYDDGRSLWIFIEIQSKLHGYRYVGFPEQINVQLSYV